MEFIAHDWCGYNDQYGRYTHVPNGTTLVCQAWMGQKDWDQAQLEFLQQFPNLNVHDCPTGPYSTNGRLMGSTNEICARLKERL